MAEMGPYKSVGRYVFDRCTSLLYHRFLSISLYAYGVLKYEALFR